MIKKILLFSFAIAFFSESASSQIFYKIESDFNPKPSYIFGSHHLAPISFLEEAGVMEYFNETEQVVGEIDMTMDPATLSLIMQPFMTAPSDSTLSVLLAGEDMNVLNQSFEKWSPLPGLTLQMLDPLKPMAVSTMIGVGLSSEAMEGYDPDQQLDTYFFKKGKENGRKIKALETPEFQGEVLFNMTPLTVQAEALIEMLKNPDDALQDAIRLTDAYKERNLDQMLEISKEDNVHPEFMELILYKRNDNWMTELPAIIKETPSFIVVGALHLAGERGIIEQLKASGFKVEPIY